MNSVFSAFKSSKNSNPPGCNGETKKGATSKKVLKESNNSYEKLRHIREKMSGLVMDDDDIQINLIKRLPLDLDGQECFDDMDSGTFQHLSEEPNQCQSGEFCGKSLENGDAHLQNGQIHDTHHTHHNGDSSESNEFPVNGENGAKFETESKTGSMSSSSSSSSLTTSLSSVKKHDYSPCDTSLSTNNLVIIKSMPLINDANSKSASSIFSKPTINNASRMHRPRLSLSSIGGNNQLMPSVHGRPIVGPSAGTEQKPQTRQRLSTHQRNLSLDFRWVSYF